jgi:hypothetical protein
MVSVDNMQPLYMNAACLVDEWIYFTSFNSSWLYRLNVESEELEAICLIDNTGNSMKFSGLHYYNGMIWLIPWNAGYIYIYKISDSGIEQLPVPKEGSDYNRLKRFRKSIIQGRYLWLLPFEYPGVVRVDMEDKSYSIYNEWPEGVYFDKAKKTNFKMMTLYDKDLYLFNDACSMSIRLSTETGKMTRWNEGYNRSFGDISRDKLYTAPIKEFDTINIINIGDNRIVKEISLPDRIWMKQPQYIYCYWYTKAFENKIFYMPHEANGILLMDSDTERIDIINIDISDYMTPREHKNYAVYDILQYKDCYLTIPYQGNKIVLVDGNGASIREYILEADRKYLTIDFHENDRFNLREYTDMIKCTDIKKINWNNSNSEPTKEDAGYRINKTILEGIGNV